MKKFLVLLFGLSLIILIEGCVNWGELFPFLNKAAKVEQDELSDQNYYDRLLYFTLHGMRR